jgi:5-methylcytosine-specific restriction protein A
VPKDPRTADQKRHDIFAVVLDAAARAAETPSIGGAAPTVLVSVRQADLDADRGVGHIDGIEIPISLGTVRQLICTGGTQKVLLGPEGRLISLGSPERCFTAQQRRAILLRDGGCTIPAGWVELHHVHEHSDGGPTHTSNGVGLCWFHHRTLNTSGWEIRMLHGVPQVKAPPWLDPHRHWRNATKSPTLLTDHLDHTRRE